MKAEKGLVSGRVQGVFFRRAVQEGCQRAGLRGYARNLADGRVEVLLIGTDEQVEQGKQLVRQGSPRSAVTDVEWEAVADYPDIRGFETR